MAYLVDHPPRIRQYRRPRRSKPSGVVVVHTAESYPDETGPDTGAENVARFIRDRTNYGSYHDLADSDSIINLVPYDAEAFHDGTGSNPHSYGVSAATQAHRWDDLGDEWVDATVRNMARATARYARWVKANHGVTIPAERISRRESELRIAGFISHAERDPDRRTDPGASFPWDDFLDYYAAEMSGAPTPPEEDPMAKLDAEDKAWLQKLFDSWKDDFARELLRTEVTGTGQAETILGPKAERGDTVASLLAYAAAGGIRNAETRKYLISLGVGYRNDGSFPDLDADVFKLLRDAAMNAEIAAVAAQSPPDLAAQIAAIRERYEAAK